MSGSTNETSIPTERSIDKREIMLRGTSEYYEQDAQREIEEHTQVVERLGNMVIIERSNNLAATASAGNLTEETTTPLSQSDSWPKITLEISVNDLRASTFFNEPTLQKNVERFCEAHRVPVFKMTDRTRLFAPVLNEIANFTYSLEGDAIENETKRRHFFRHCFNPKLYVPDDNSFGDLVYPQQNFRLIVEMKEADKNISGENGWAQLLVYLLRARYRQSCGSLFGILTNNVLYRFVEMGTDYTTATHVYNWNVDTDKIVIRAWLSYIAQNVGVQLVSP